MNDRVINFLWSCYVLAEFLLLVFGPWAIVGLCLWGCFT